MSVRGIGLAILAVVLALAAGAYLGTWIHDADKPQDEQRDGADDLEALRATRRDLEDRVSRLEDLARAQRAPARVLDRVSVILPDSLSLERLSVRGKTVTIAGKAADTWAVSDFVESLYDTRGFDEPETQSITATHDGYRFSLAFPIDPNAILATDVDSDPPSESTVPSGPAQSGEDLWANISELKARYDRLLPDTRQTDDLLRRIRALARETHVALLRFKPREIIEGDSHRQWPIDISVDAPYHGLVSFLDQIGQSGRIVVPSNLDLVAGQGGSGTTATMVLTAYLRNHGASGVD